MTQPHTDKSCSPLALSQQARKPARAAARLAAFTSSLRQWFDADAAAVPQPCADRIDWLRAVPFIALHLGCFGALWVGVSPFALLVAALSYVIRMFALTGFYHRYFAHRAFHASRGMQFAMALLGATCAQRG